MYNKKVVVLAGLLACLASVSSFAATLGDAALPLTVQEWIKGQPVDVKPGTNIWVLVFCSLSRANDFALTNLTALQKTYQDKGVVVVAISDEPAEQLKEFVQIKGAKIGFTVAADDLRRTTTSYQQVFQQALLPRAYVVGKDGKMLWQGHPLTGGLGEAVDEIVSGRYNHEQTQKNIITRDEMDQYLALARQDDTNSVSVGRMLLFVRKNDAAALCDLAYQIATDPFIANTNRDVVLAGAALDRAVQLGAINITDITVDRAILLFQTGKEEEGLAKARQALASAQSQDEKDEAQTCVHAMEVRLAAAKTNQITAPAAKP